MQQKIKFLKTRGMRYAEARIRGVLAAPKPHGHILMMHNGRSGSTLLGDMLDQHRRIFWDGETFEKQIHRKKDGMQVGFENLYHHFKLEDALGEVSARMKTRTGNRLFGTEIQEYQLRMMGTTINDYLKSLKEFGFSRFIFVERNYLRILVSHLIATERRLHHVSPGETLSQPTIKINPERIYVGHRKSTLLEALERYRDFSRAAYSLCSAEDFLHLHYEADIEDDPMKAIDKVCDFLGLERHTPRIKYGKTTARPLKDIITNYDEIQSYLSITDFGDLFDEAGRLVSSLSEAQRKAP